MYNLGLFSTNYNKPGPGVPKDAPKKKGIMRLFEILGRDFGNLIKVNFLFFVCSVPTIVITWFYVLTLNFEGFYLGFFIIALALLWTASFLLGPAIAATQAVIVDMVRDKPGYVWHTFKDKFKSNFKQASLLGIFFSTLYFLEFIGVYLYLQTNLKSLNVLVIALFLFNLILVISVSLYAFLQEIYLDLKNFAIVKNSLLLTFGMAKRSLPATLLTIVIVFAFAIFLPLTGILYIIILPAFVFLVADMWLWPTMEKTFHISAMQDAKRDGIEYIPEETESEIKDDNQGDE